MCQQSKTLSFEGQNIYLGIDVHLKSWNVSVMVENVFYQTFSQSPSVTALKSYLEKHFPRGTYHCVYEAGFSGFWLHYQLCTLGYHSMVVHPADIPTTGKEKVYKTDSRDSKKLVRSLSNGELTPIHVPRLSTQHDRKLLQSRVCIVRNLVQYKLRIRALLNFYGIEIPSEFAGKQNCWSKLFVDWLKQTANSSQASQEHLLFLIRQLEHFRTELLSITGLIRKLSQRQYYQKNMLLLQGVPGIGLISGMSLLTEIEDIKRFPSIDSLCNYMGLVPSCHDSGDHQSTGKITPRSHSLRNILIECAWSAIRKDPSLTKAYVGYCQQMKPNKAIVRIARKLLSRIKHVLDHDQEYKINVL